MLGRVAAGFGPCMATEADTPAMARSVYRARCVGRFRRVFKHGADGVRAGQAGGCGGGG